MAEDSTLEIKTKNGRLVYLAIRYIEAERNDSMPAYAQIIRRFINGNHESAFYAFFSKHPDVCGQNRSISIYQVEAVLEKLCQDGFVRISKTGRKGNIYSITKAKPQPEQTRTIAAPGPTGKMAMQPTTRTKTTPAGADTKETFVSEIQKRIHKNDKFQEYSSSHVSGIKLMSHQKAGAELAARYHRFAFFYDTGTGKTIMTLNIIAERYKKSGTRFLIVAPKPLIKSAWLDDAKYFPQVRILPISANITFEEYKALYNKWAKEEGKLLDWDLMYDRKRSISLIIEKLAKWAHHVIVNSEQIIQPSKAQAVLDIYGIKGLIVDESSILKNHDSKTAQRMRVLAKQMDYVYILSGKPAPNSPVEYFSQMKIVDPTTFSMSFDAFKDKYFMARGSFKLVFKNQYSQRAVSEMIGRRSIFVKKEECLDLPDEVSMRIQVDMDPKSFAFYSQVMQNMVTEIVAMDGSELQTRNMGHLARIAKLREIASGFYLDSDNQYYISPSKLNTLMLVLDEIGDNQVIIWCNFQFEIEIIERELKKHHRSVVTAYGKTKQLDENIRLFKTGECQYMIAHPKTLKYGVTFTKCHYAVYNSLSYSFEDYYQSHDRIYRAGQRNNCFYYHLLSENTIDQVIYENIGNKHMTAKIFEQLIKKSSKFGLRKDQIDRALSVSPKTQAIATSIVNVDQT